jgi:predicted O-methyltransferase YrrM
MDIIDPNIQEYLSAHSRHLTPELEELERQTYLRVLLPNMISGKEQGAFLNIFFGALKPKLALEIGTFTGYSAISMALAMDEDAKLITMDINVELEPLVREYIAKSGLEHRIDYRLGDAMQMIDSIEDHSLDVVFIDADKRNYPHYAQKLKLKLKKEGILLIDNVLWHGKVVQEIPNKDTQAILDTNKMVFEDLDYITSIVPLRDGILMARKIK